MSTKPMPTLSFVVAPRPAPRAPDLSPDAGRSAYNFTLFDSSFILHPSSFTPVLRFIASILLILIPALARAADPTGLDLMDTLNQPAAAPAPLPISGVFVDSGGGRHPWSISPAHALIWEDAPWIPAGMVYTPASLSGLTDKTNGDHLKTASDTVGENAAGQNSAQLDSLSAAGVTDVLLEAPQETPPAPKDSAAAPPLSGAGGQDAPPLSGAGGQDAPPLSGAGGLDAPALSGAGGPTPAGSRGFADIPAPAAQAVLDTLDTHHFHYGIDLHAVIRTPLDGYSLGEKYTIGKSLTPGSFTAPAPPGVTAALYVIRDSANAVISMGRAALVDGVLSADVPDGAGSCVFINERKWGESNGVANLWDGFAECRDRVLFALRSLKFGPGLRFFLDPLAGSLEPGGRAAYFYPASAHFQIDFESYLRRRYPDIATLTDHWGAAPGSITSFEMAARLAPDASLSPDAAWDPQTGALVELNPGASALWIDFVAFRSEETRHEMDLLASSIQHNIADVPVVYSWERFSPLYVGAGSDATLDGLAIHPVDSGDASVTRAAYTCAQVADAPRNLWFLMYGGGDQWNLGRLAKLLNLGVKGFFLTPANDRIEPGILNPEVNVAKSLSDSIRSVRLAPAAGEDPNRRQKPGLESIATIEKEVIQKPKRTLAPNGAFGSKPSPAAAPQPAGYADYWPHILWFPWDMQVASVRRLDDGSWWMPSFRGATEVPCGPDLEAYYMADANGGSVVIWSPTGGKTIHIHMTKDARIVWPEGARPGKTSHGLTEISLGDSPVALQGVQLLDLFPSEALEKTMQQADELRTSPLLSSSDKQQLDLLEANAKHMEKAGLRYDAYLRLTASLDTLRRLVLPYVWVEGEKPVSSSFDGAARSSQCSGGAYLWLNNPDDAPDGKPYQASWKFDVKAPGDYELWLGGTPPGEDWSSPVAWSLDGTPLMTEGHGAAGPIYRPQFHWSLLGTLKLSAGSHTISATVTGRRIEPDNSYFLGVDALVFVPTPDVTREILKGQSMPGEVAAINQAIAKEPMGR